MHVHIPVSSRKELKTGTLVLQAISHFLFCGIGVDFQKTCADAFSIIPQPRIDQEEP